MGERIERARPALMSGRRPEGRTTVRAHAFPPSKATPCTGRIGRA
jgi:hypothetical protein